ncbi:MAG: hypothetical protein CVT89_06375 [Candidatus Altiarchaeales archaeon HGW-Altiarchaeales-2]|nr:MAG: hypothetical protein CVT89_06375 [Candidatus Altiarchaeales archaeon HGW-Altiarchaeales-2]
MSKYIVPIGVLIAAVLIIVGGYIILNPQNPSQTSENQDNNAGFIELSSGEAHSPKITVSATELQKNANPSFKVGNKYKYKQTSQNTMQTTECITPGGGHSTITFTQTGGDDENNESNSAVPSGCVVKNETRTQNIIIEFAVEKTERVEGKECFVISEKSKTEISEEQKENMTQGAIRMQEVMSNHITYYYYDKETGNVIQVKYSSPDGSTTTITGTMAESSSTHSTLFSKWMLALKDDFIWEQSTNSSSDMYESKDISTYAVKGQENINNRDCFNVEITETAESNIKDSMFKGKKNYEHKTIRTMWVDVNERIIVKQTTKSGSLTTSTTELVDES